MASDVCQECGRLGAHDVSCVYWSATCDEVRELKVTMFMHDHVPIHRVLLLMADRIIANCERGRDH